MIKFLDDVGRDLISSPLNEIGKSACIRFWFYYALEPKEAGKRSMETIDPTNQEKNDESFKFNLSPEVIQGINNMYNCVV